MKRSLNSPTYSSHDVILQRATTLSYITLYGAALTAKDKPDDECFLLSKVRGINYYSPGTTSTEVHLFSFDCISS